jgi:hypothetical protein
MQKLCIFSLLISFFLLAQFCSAGSDEVQDTTAVKTGDIEVTAVGIKLPPYKVGLKLELNKMPEMVIPDWVKPYPQDNDEQEAWFNETYHRLGRVDLWVINYIFDSLGINRQVLRSVIFYDENKIAEGLTDSMGHYTFKNVPVGRYQVVCYPERLPSELMDAEDSLLYGLRKIGNSWSGEPLGEDIREPGAIDFVRIAPDSVSIVSVFAFHASSSFAYINHVENWKDKFKNRKGDKNGNDQNIKQDSVDCNMRDDN